MCTILGMDTPEDGLLVGYARCSTDKQEVAGQRAELQRLGVDPTRIYIDEALSGQNRDRPALERAMAATRAGDQFVVTKLDRFARSVMDANTLMDDLHARGVAFNMGGHVYRWHDEFARMFLQQLAVFAEFELNLIRRRTREGMQVAKSKGRLQGKKPKLSSKQQAELLKQYRTGEHTISDLAELWNVSRPTVYRVIQRDRDRHTAALAAGENQQGDEQTSIPPANEDGDRT